MLKNTEITKGSIVKFQGLKGTVIGQVPDGLRAGCYIVSPDYNPGFPEFVKASQITVIGHENDEA